MNVALAFFGRELRAQWPMLLGYALTAFLSLAGVIHLAGPNWLHGVDRAQAALGWFVLIGVLGAAVILAPSAVRNEVQGRDDQFVRRLPGALAPALAGKLAFVMLGGALLALLGLGLGQLFLAWQHERLAGAFELQSVLSGRWFTQAPMLAALVTGILVPWVFAVACWMPGARMAIGAVLVMLVALAMAGNGVLKLCPSLDRVLAFSPWFWWFAPLGFAVAWVSFVRGRRGGSWRRSALLGGAATILGLLPPAAYLGHYAVRYHYPDLDNLVYVAVHGTDPGNRFAFVTAASIERLGTGPLLRVDLATGEHERVAGPGTWPWCIDSARQLWHVHHSRESLYVDLVTGERFETTPARDPAAAQRLRTEMRSRNRPQAIATLNGTTVSLVGNGVHFEDGDGRTETVEMDARYELRIVGDGMTTSNGACFDFATRRWRPTAAVKGAWCLAVDGKWLFGENHGFTLRDATDGTPWQWDTTQGRTVTALHSGDNRALVLGTQRRLWLFDPHTRTATPVTMPADLPDFAHWDSAFGGDRRPIDGSGGTWLDLKQRQMHRMAYLRVDTTTNTAAVVTLPQFRIVAALEGDWLLGVADDRSIERRNWRTGERRRLFPHQGGAR